MAQYMERSVMALSDEALKASGSVDGIDDSSSPSYNWQHPPSFYCPISKQVMHEPVVLSDGHSYERRHIERWLQDRNTSPVSNDALPQKEIFPNHALRNAIEEYFEQVFSVHRRAICKTIKCPAADQSLGSNQPLLCTIDALMQCSFLMNADLSVECILQQIMDQARNLLGTEAASVFLVDVEKKELYSSVNSSGSEIRIPITSGIAGHVASTGETVVIDDAYSDDRFNRGNDLKTGFRTHNMMCVPLKMKKGMIIGVVQLINKTCSGVFSRSADSSRPGFTQQDLQFLQVFASQAATAVANCGGVLRETCNQPQQLTEDTEREENSEHDTSSELKQIPDPDISPKTCSITGADDIKVRDVLQDAFNGWNFDGVELAEITGNKPLSTLGMYLFEETGLVTGLDLDAKKLKNFLVALENGYDDTNPYHNRAHAASVMHAMYALLKHGGLASILTSLSPDADKCARKREELGMLACLLAAAMHDHEHMGLSNEFLVRTGHVRAVLYNDQHVNEHHHAASGFAILQKEDCNFASAFAGEDFSQLRNLVIELILGTDMANGGKIQKSFGEVFGSLSGTKKTSPPTPVCREDAVLLLQMAMKCADLGHLALGYDVHRKWVERLEQEFFAQGDREKSLGLSASFLMDRDKPGCSQTQVSFFQLVALPLFQSLVDVVPLARPMLDAVTSNSQRWRLLDEAADGHTPSCGRRGSKASIGTGVSTACGDESSVFDTLASGSMMLDGLDFGATGSEVSLNDSCGVASERSADCKLSTQDSEVQGESRCDRFLPLSSLGASIPSSKKKSGRARQRAARWWASVRQRTPSPDTISPFDSGTPVSQNRFYVY
jgi:cAMP-specific phosphodiesterase 4/calcium/calmodulin-dependent 3',5'-cyclic nucleotide phosphodiesterase